MNCNIQDFKLSPSEVRKKILDMAYSGTSGHIGCAFSIVELVLESYKNFIRVNPSDSKDALRDFFVLSKGHGVMALYVVLAEIGIIDKEDLRKYFQDGSRLHGLGEFGVPGIEVSGGSLGHGICVAQGMAYGLKRKNSDQKVFCLVGDGEINEGSFWETVMFASAKNLNNLTIIIDTNGFQAMGETSAVLDLGDLAKKFNAFNFFTTTCNGHSLEEINSSLSECVNAKRPSVLIAKTIKGKGVSFFENDNIWHYKKMTDEDYDKAIAELQ